MKNAQKNGEKLTIVSDRSSKKIFIKTAFTKIFSSTHSNFFYIINEKQLIFEEIVKFFDFYLDLRDKPVVYEFFIANVWKHYAKPNQAKIRISIFLKRNEGSENFAGAFSQLGNRVEKKKFFKLVSVNFLIVSNFLN